MRPGAGGTWWDEMAGYGAWNGTHRRASGELRYVGELLRGGAAPDRSRNRLAERVRATARRFGEQRRGASPTAIRSTLSRTLTTGRS